MSGQYLLPQPKRLVNTNTVSSFRCKPLLAIALGVLTAALPACKKHGEPDPKVPEFGSCKQVSPTGGLSYTPGSTTFSYQTAGGWKISINTRSAITITKEDLPQISVDFWGGNQGSGASKFAGTHENLDGKHVKDKLGANRTFILPDGAKITMIAMDNIAPMLSFSIYDKNESHHFNIDCNTLESSIQGSETAKRLDDAEADGETATFELEMVNGAVDKISFVNIYDELTPGEKNYNRVLIAMTSVTQPNNVIDYYP